MSPRAIALSLLLLVAIAGGAYLALGNDSDGGTVETEEDPGIALREDSKGRNVNPEEEGNKDSTRERILGQTGESGSGSKTGAGAKMEEGESLVRVRFVQNKKALADRGVGLKSLSGPGSSLHRTDGEGRLEITGLSSGRYRFTIDGEDVPRGKILPVFQLGKKEEKDLGDMNVPVPVTVIGSVRAESGSAIADVLVTLGKQGFSDFLNENAEAPSVKSDSQGRFSLTRLAPGKFVLRMDHPSYLRLDRSLEFKEGEQVDLGVLELSAGRMIRGQVVDQLNKPIAGVEIQAEIQTRIGTSLIQGYSKARAVLSDEQGRFEIGGLGSVTRLLLQKKGYQEKRDQDVDMDKGFVRIQLQVERGISGRVSGIPTGRGREVRVHVSEHVNLGAGGMELYMDRQAVNCDDKGYFHITGLEKGDYRLIAALEGHGFSQKHNLSLGDRSVSGIDLTLGRGGELVVRAVDKQQRPIANARIVLEAIDPLPDTPGRRVRMRGRGAIRLRGRTDEQGVARLEGIFEGHARLSVQHDLYLGFAEEIELVQGRQEKLVQLSLGGWVEGVALDSSGFPAKGAEILIAKKSINPGGNVFEVDVEHGQGEGSAPVRRQSLRTGGEGGFKSEALAPGLYEVWFKRVTEIRAGGASITIMDGQEKKPGLVEVQVVEGQVSKIQLKKPVSGSLQGLVTYKGMPAARAQVFAWPVGKDSFDAKQALAGKDGHFRLDDLEPGSWQYCAKPESGGVATPIQRFEVPATGGEIHRNLKLGGGLIRGRCRMPAGRSLQGGLMAVLEEGTVAGEKPKEQTRRMTLMMTADSSGSRKLSQIVMRPPTDPEPVRIKKDGSFEIDYVSAGPWQLLIEGKSNVRMASRTFELGQDQTLDLGIIDLALVFPVQLQVLDEQGQPLKMGSVVVYRKNKGKASERVWSGLVQDGKIRVPGLAPGQYTLQFSKISMGRGGRGEPQTTDLEIHTSGTAVGTDFRFK